MALVFFGRFSGLTDDSDIECDEHADGGCDRRNRLSCLKPEHREALRRQEAIAGWLGRG